jgi:aspartate/methionine/tyrosine aminotransferase
VQVNPRLLTITESATVHIADRIRELEAKGRKVIKLQTGDPDFATPRPIVEAACSAVKDGLTHYSASRGLADLRVAIGKKLRSENKVTYDPKTEILVTHGGVHAVFIAINSLIRPRDKVLIIDPCWTPYVSSTIIAGGKPVRISTYPEDGFRVRAERIEDAIDEGTRLLIVNSPSNPSGAVLSKEELKCIAELAQAHDLYVIADEVYERLVYEGRKHISLASLPGMKERTITVNSFSKTYAMTGWRIGYLAANPELVNQILKFSQYSITNVCPFVQKGALVALTDRSLEKSVERMMGTYSKRRQKIIKALKGIDKIGMVIPQGAFYFMLDVSKADGNSKRFANELLERNQVAVVPGEAFGRCAKGFVRITFAAPDEQIFEGLSRLIRIVQSQSHRSYVVRAG